MLLQPFQVQPAFWLTSGLLFGFQRMECQFLRRRKELRHQVIEIHGSEDRFDMSTFHIPGTRTLSNTVVGGP